MKYNLSQSTALAELLGCEWTDYGKESFLCQINLEWETHFEGEYSIAKYVDEKNQDKVCALIALQSLEEFDICEDEEESD